MIVAVMSERASGLPRLPIRLRLTLAFGAVLAVMLGAAGVVLYSQFERDLDRTISRDLRSRVRDVAAIAEEQRAPREVLAESGERFAQLYTRAGRPLASTRRVSGVRLLSGGEARRAGGGDLLVERRDTAIGALRVRAGPARDRAGLPLVVAVGEPLGRRDRALDRLRTLLFLIGPFALLLASYAGYQVAGAALRPVERMRARAERITDRDVSERLPVPATGDEIESLGRTLNELLSRLDAALARERRLLSDASHELRTPLSVLRTEIQLGLRGDRDSAELRESLRAAGHETERLTRLADDLLVLARADQGRLPIRPEPLAVSEMLETAVQRASGAGGGRVIRAEAGAAAGAVALGDPDRTAQALDNLVANALAYGDGEVRLSAREVDGRVELHVTDDGEGFDEELLPRAFERFSQGDRGRSGAGSGLGLAIVAAIARAQGGDAGARNPPGGGADVWISLPAA